MLVPSGAAHNPDQMHLHIVCNDTCSMGYNLLISVSTFYDGCDATCELTADDHGWLKHLSYVFYAKAKIYKAEDLDRGFKSEKLVLHEEMSNEVFARIEAGICASSDTPRKIKTYFGCGT